MVRRCSQEDKSVQEEKRHLTMLGKGKRQPSQAREGRLGVVGNCTPRR